VYGQVLIAGTTSCRGSQWTVGDGVAMAGGRFILSLDVELAWGSFDHGGHESDREELIAEREATRRLLSLLDQYEVPATFAVVGHLFLSSCERVDGTTHPDVERPRHQWFPRDWHAFDPATDLARDPLWYGPDILKGIVRARAGHEIATHTFSHVVAGDPACTPEILRSQLLKCRELHRQWGQPLDSIVFPRNSVAHLDVLRDVGILAYRGPESSWYRGVSERARPIAHVLDRALAVTPPTYRLDDRRDGKLVDLPASMFLLARNGPRRLIPLASRRAQALRGIERACERGEVFHLWFHPRNLTTDAGLFDVLGDVLRRVESLASRGHIVPVTMGGLARTLIGEAKSATRGRSN